MKSLIMHMNPNWFQWCGYFQTCVSANRLFIQDTVFDEFVQKLEAAMKTLTLGDGAEAGINTGPLINNAQAKKASTF